eukprot:TRINITY_DN13214_c0_g1_i1.p1 TRINITY_DN13214_c0_g1~~TRINITY_DN13214_c0_g1_i1.p1  ORF type:complete len:505 (+),score=177.94 TRINITY_DN13214_c0_g1_i1:108-1517(+)
MIGATEAQLQNITAKSDKLEVLMTTRIEEVRRIKREHDELDQEVTELRARLANAEARYASVQRALDESTSSLKLVADEYNRAQLLKKKYHNHLAELKGGPRVVVRLRDPSDHDGPPAPRQRQSRHDWGAVCVADPCTINVPSKSKSFVFDAVITPDDPSSPADIFQAVNGPGMVADLLGGFNVCLFSFGQRGAGKTHTMLGAGEGGGATGLVDVFIQQLFAAMEHNDVDCFTAKAQMLELHGDLVTDLFSDPGAPVDGAPVHLDILRDERGRVLTTGLQQVSVTSAAQLAQLFRWGMQSRERRRDLGDPRRGGRGHLSFSVALENYSRKGNFRRSRLTLVDVAGASGAEESAWVNRSLAGLGDVISTLSTATQRRRAQGGTDPAEPPPRVPYQSTKLATLLSEALGGNCKTTMLCCILPSPGLMEQLLTALIYAYHLKCIQNPITPFDIPADLQKLDQQIRSLDLDLGP